MPKLRKSSFFAYLAAVVVVVLVVFTGQFTIIPIGIAICVAIILGIPLGYYSTKNTIKLIQEGKMKELSTATRLAIVIPTIVVCSFVVSYFFTASPPSGFILKYGGSSILLFLALLTISAVEMQIYLFNKWERVNQREILIDEAKFFGYSRIYSSPSASQITNDV